MTDSSPPLRLGPSTATGTPPLGAFAVILLASGAVFGFLCWLLYVKQPVNARSAFLDAIPAINAGFNGLSTVLLCCGFAAIWRRRVAVHLRFMSAALCSSALFLVGYVIHHYNSGDTRYLNHGRLIRPAYLTLLASHVAMSAVAVPLILTSFFLSLTGRYAWHKRVSRFTFPIWLYVSVTGVAVYAFLRLTNHP